MTFILLRLVSHFGVVLLHAPTVVGATGTEAVVGMVALILVRGLQVFLDGLHLANSLLCSFIDVYRGFSNPHSPSRSG